jgi:hypothetical protein
MLLWTACLCISYLPFGLAASLPDLLAQLPPASGYAFHRWWLDLGVALLLAVAAHAHGASTLDRLRLETQGVEWILTATALGMALLVLSASVLGFVSLFRVGVLRSLLALFVATGLWQARVWRQRIGRHLREIAAERAAIAPLLLALLFVGITLVAAAAPETSYDALSWHLPTARFFLQQGRFAYMELYRSNVPHYGTIFYALGLAIRRNNLNGEATARMFHFLLYPGMLLAAAALAARLTKQDGDEDKQPNLLPQSLAALWIASSPLVMHRATTCYPDLGASLWGVQAVLAFLQFHATRRRAWVVLCGLFAGLAAGSKFVGFYWIVIGGLLVTLSALADTSEEHNRRNAWRLIATFAIVSGAVCAPWMIRNWIYTGDPVLPMLQRVLPHPRMDLREVTNLLTDADNRERIPASLKNFLALPWRLTMEGDRWQGAIGPVFLWLAPLWILGGLRKNNGAWWWISAVLLLFSCLWLRGPQWSRYYLPALPLLAGLGAAAVCHPRLPRWSRAVLVAVGMIFPLVDLPGLNHSWISGGAFVLQDIPWNVAIGRESEETYRREQLTDYDAAEFLNGQTSYRGAILPVPGFHFFPQWLTRLRVLNVWENAQAVCLSDSHRLVDCYHLRGPTLIHNMDNLGVSILAIRRDQDWSAHRDALRLEDPSLRRYFRILEYVGGTFVYARDPAAPKPDVFYINADLTARWFQHRHAGASAGVRLLPQRPNAEDTRYSLQFVGESSAWFELPVGDRPRLAFSVAQDPRYFGSDLPGTLSISAGDTQAKPVSQLQYSLSSDELRRGWRDFQIDLSEFSGRTVRIEIRLQPAQAGQRPTLAIADPVVYAQETTEPARDQMPDEDARWLFQEATKLHPVDVRLTPSVVHRGAFYEMEIPELAGQLVDLLYSLNGGEPSEAPHFRRLDAAGRVRVDVARDFEPIPATIMIHGVRRTGDKLWLAANAQMDVSK